VLDNNGDDDVEDNEGVDGCDEGGVNKGNE
jgi:hypothetical protein